VKAFESEAASSFTLLGLLQVRLTNSWQSLPHWLRQSRCISSGGRAEYHLELNTLIPAGSPLFLVAAFRINSRGEIVGLAFNTTTQEAHAYLASPGGSALRHRDRPTKI
jgi:hypothetical protein